MWGSELPLVGHLHSRARAPGLGTLQPLTPSFRSTPHTPPAALVQVSPLWSVEEPLGVTPHRKGASPES